MQTSAQGRKLIEGYEGLRTKAYQDIAGVWTIGYGHTSAAGLPKVTSSLTITREEADSILVRDLKKTEAEVEHLVNVPLNQNQFDALVSFTYNVGPGALAKSTLLRKLNSGDYNLTSEFKKWIRSGKNPRVPGLVKRRQEEAELFATPAKVVKKTFWDFLFSFLSKLFKGK